MGLGVEGELAARHPPDERVHRLERTRAARTWRRTSSQGAPRLLAGRLAGEVEQVGGAGEHGTAPFHPAWSPSASRIALGRVI